MSDIIIDNDNAINISFEPEQDITIEISPVGKQGQKGDKGDPGEPVWGSITGILSHQEDLQDALDSKASTAYLGALAVKDTADYETDVVNRPELGALADHDYVDYLTEIANRPILGALASKNTADWDSDIDNIPTAFPPESHDHDDRYYTEGETDTKLSGKQNTLAVEELTITHGFASTATTSITAQRYGKVVCVQGFSNDSAIANATEIIKDLPVPQTLSGRYLWMDSSSNIHIMYFVQEQNSTKVRIQGSGGPFAGFQGAFCYIAK